MNTLLLSIILFLIPFISDAQNTLVDVKYKTNILVGSTDYGWSDDTKSVKLSSAAGESWGYFVEFKSDGTFLAYNQNKCGNDCRVKVSGTYIIRDNQIEMTRNLVRYMDICATRPKVEREELLGTFEIVENDEHILLKRE